MKAPCALVGAALPGIAIKQAATCAASSRTACCARRGSSGCRTITRGCSRCRPTRRSAATCARCSASTTRPHAQAHAEPRRLPLGARRRARGRRADRHEAARRRRRRRSPERNDATFPVQITDPAGCGRFAGRVIRNVNAAAPTPGLDERAPGARGPALDLGAGRRHQLRDARARPAAARLRPRQAAGRASTCASAAAGEKVKLLNEQTVEVDPRRARASPTTRGPIGLAGIMGGDSTKADLDDARRVPRVGVLLPDGDRRAARGATTSRATPRTASSAASTSTTTSQGIERATR